MSHIQGLTYRRLLKGFNFAEATAEGLTPCDLTKRYQTAWDGFADIYNTINSGSQQNNKKVKAKIKKWFKAFTSDYLAQQEVPVGSDPKLLKLQKNDPLFLASFLLTPYYHGLCDHIWELIGEGDLRTFCGQNFEKMNNDHRLFWQNSNKVKGCEIFSILHQHLRVRMNPVRRGDLTIGSMQCPLCSHPPYTKPKWFKNHILVVHTDTAQWNREFVQERVKEQVRARRLLAASTRSFALQVTEVEFPALATAKAASNKRAYIKNREKAKAFTSEWSQLTQPDASDDDDN